MDQGTGPCAASARYENARRKRGPPIRRASFVSLAARLLILLVAHDLALLVALEVALALLAGRLGVLVVTDGALAVPGTRGTGRGRSALALGVAAVELL